MTQFRERLWPAPWLFVATALVIPASFLVFLPINEIAGLVVAFVLYAGERPFPELTGRRRQVVDALVAASGRASC